MDHCQNGSCNGLAQKTSTRRNINWTHSSKLKQHTINFLQGNAFKNVFCKMTANLCWPQRVNGTSNFRTLFFFIAKSSCYYSTCITDISWKWSDIKCIVVYWYDLYIYITQLQYGPRTLVIKCFMGTVFQQTSAITKWSIPSPTARLIPALQTVICGRQTRDAL